MLAPFVYRRKISTIDNFGYRRFDLARRSPRHGVVLDKLGITAPATG
jgi:hypothetical protein